MTLPLQSTFNTLDYADNGQPACIMVANTSFYPSSLNYADNGMPCWANCLPYLISSASSSTTASEMIKVSSNINSVSVSNSNSQEILRTLSYLNSCISDSNSSSQEILKINSKLNSCISNNISNSEVIQFLNCRFIPISINITFSEATKFLLLTLVFVANSTSSSNINNLLCNKVNLNSQSNSSASTSEFKFLPLYLIARSGTNTESLKIQANSITYTNCLLKSLLNAKLMNINISKTLLNPGILSKIIMKPNIQTNSSINSVLKISSNVIIQSNNISDKE